MSDLEKEKGEEKLDRPERPKDSKELIYRLALNSGMPEALPFEDYDKFINWMVRSLKEIFAVDVAGFVMKTNAYVHEGEPKGYKLAALIDDNGRVAEQNMVIGKVYSHQEDAPEYISDFWELTSNPKYTPHKGLGIDGWIQITNPEGNVIGWIFLDATDEEFDIHPYSKAIQRIALQYSQYYRKAVEIRELIRKLKNIIKKQRKEIEQLRQTGEDAEIDIDVDG